MDTTRLNELLNKPDLTADEKGELQNLHQMAKIMGLPGIPVDLAPEQLPDAQPAVEGAEFPEPTQEVVGEPEAVQEPVSQEPEVQPEPVVPFEQPQPVEEPVAQPEPEVQPEPVQEPVRQFSPAEEVINVSLSTIAALMKQLRMFRGLYTSYAPENVAIAENKLKEAEMWLNDAQAQEREE